MGKGAGKGEAGYPLLAADGAVVQMKDDPSQSVKRSFNFCAGPAMLDSDAMLSMCSQFADYQGTGIGLIEMSQRDKGGPVQTIISGAVENIRKLLSVPDNYNILLFQVCLIRHASIPHNHSKRQCRYNAHKSRHWSKLTSYCCRVVHMVSLLQSR